MRWSPTGGAAGRLLRETGILWVILFHFNPVSRKSPKTAVVATMLISMPVIITGADVVVLVLQTLTARMTKIRTQTARYTRSHVCMVMYAWICIHVMYA